MLQTEKIYYQDQYLSRLETTLTAAGYDFIELSATIAYPEGGGQESDMGEITIGDQVFRFILVKKIGGSPTGLAEFPDILVGGTVRHYIHLEDQSRLSQVAIGDKAVINIDIERRHALTLSHTASHILYMAVAEHRLQAVAGIFGCHIRINTARLDFYVEQRFVPDEIALIETSANILIKRNLPITIAADKRFSDARNWYCDDYLIPCGGTHLPSSAAIGNMQLTRKSLGSNKDRISCLFPDSYLDLGLYHQ